MDMAPFNATAGTYESKVFEILPSDIYRMKIVKADIQQNTFAEQKSDGTYPEQLVLCWEVSQVLGEQDEGVVGLSVWHRMAPWYGDTKRGPSKFKEFVDSLIIQKLLPDSLDLEAIDTEDFIGIEQRVNVEEYIKTMGVNKGQPGNKIVSLLALVAQKKAPTKATPTRPTVSARPAPRNVPQPIEEEPPF
jgi:hypothetical protein